MWNQELSKIIFDRLAGQYGHLLTHEELARELRVPEHVLYNRRSRGRTGGMPEPLGNVHPLQFRAAEVARWLSGETASPPTPPSAPQRRGPGRPRKAVSDGAGRVVGRR